LNILLLAAGIAMAGAAAAQQAAPARKIQGATPERVAQIERCEGHKFDTMVEIDPVKKRSTRVKLCANPGSTDADWVKTLEAAIVQIEQRAMPAAAKDKVIAELRQEAAKFASAAKPKAVSPGAPSFAGLAGNRAPIEAPTERFETSKLPPLPPPLPRKTAAIAGSVGAGAKASVPPPPAMRFRIKCLVRGESGAGSTCDYFDNSTVLALSAVEGLDKGGTLRFRRRGEARGDVLLAPLKAGQSVRVRLPGDLCRGVAFARVELELLPPQSTGTVAGRAGPFDMRC
jgi:hypothetical protein